MKVVQQQGEMISLLTSLVKGQIATLQPPKVSSQAEQQDVPIPQLHPASQQHAILVQQPSLQQPTPLPQPQQHATTVSSQATLLPQSQPLQLASVVQQSSLQQQTISNSQSRSQVGSSPPSFQLATPFPQPQQHQQQPAELQATSCQSAFVQSTLVQGGQAIQQSSSDDLMLIDDYPCYWDSAGDDSDYLSWDRPPPVHIDLTPSGTSSSVTTKSALSPTGMVSPSSSSSSIILESSESLTFQPEHPPPAPPFETPPRLKPVEQVMKDHPGKDVASLRLLAVRLARDAIFGRVEWAKTSLSGRGPLGRANQKKLNYIRSLVESRIPDKPKIEYDYLWNLCRISLSKSAQALKTNARKKLY